MIKLISLLLFVTTFIVCSARNSVKLVDVDNLRLEFLKLEETSWNFVLDYVENNIREEKYSALPEVTLIKSFEDFGDKITQVCGPISQ